MIELSAEPSAMSGLTESQKERLAALVEQYMTGMEQGLPPSVESLAADDPDLAVALEDCVTGLENLHRLVAGVDPVAKPDDVAIDSGQRRLGDFVLQAEIGRGGMGVVYRARQISLDRQVAIKLLPLASVFDTRQIARFRNEAQAAAGLHHPHIVPIYAVGCERGVHFYAMQLIDGQSMDHVVADQIDAQQQSEDSSSDPAAIRSSSRFYHSPKGGSDAAVAGTGAVLTRSGPESPNLQRRRRVIHRQNSCDSNPKITRFPDWKTAVTIAIQAAEALHAAHEFGIVHRDVKPSNLILDSNGKAWVTDFGLARCQSEVSLTGSGDVIGTMKYMSPEQARGESALVDGRTDVYSLGATLYEMLSLRPAHDGGDAPTILRIIDQESITPVRRLRFDLPRDLETVIEMAMAKNRDQRYETAQSFADDLRRVLSGEPTVARPPTVIDRVSNWATKHRNGVAITLAIGIVGFIGLSVVTAMFASAKQVSDANGARALRYEQLSRDAVDRLGTQMAELLADIPAADSVRRRLLGETLEYYQNFVDEANDDPALREDLALTYGKIGSLQDELGSSEEAIQALKRSEQLYANLVGEEPEDRLFALHWSISQNNLAESFRRNGQLQDAAIWFAKAIENQERLAIHVDSLATPESSSTPDDSEATIQLATTLNNLGLLLAGIEENDRAEQAFIRAIGLLQAIPNSNKMEATLHANLGGLLAERSPQKAIEYARKALQQQTEALEIDTGNAELATQLVLTLNTLGKAQSRLSQHRSAVESFENAIKVGRQLQTRWPDQPTYRRDLVMSLNHLGLSLSAIGKLDGAKVAFEQALVHQELLASMFPANAEVQSVLGSVLNNLGFLQQKTGLNQDAKRTFNAAVKSQILAVELAPEVPRYRTFLEKHKQNLHDLGDSS